MKRTTLSFLLTLLLVAAGYFVLQTPRPSQAQSNGKSSTGCCGPEHPVLPRELDFPYYSLQNGFGSTLNLVSDSPEPLDFTLSVHARSGQMVVAPKMTIDPQAKLPIDMAALLKGLGADVTGDFSEGSVSLKFVGTIMPLVGQMTVTNPALRLVHESEMVENDPGRTDIPQELDGLWWNISGGRDAQVMVTNTSAFPASADVFLDYEGTRHPSAVLSFKPYEIKTVSVISLLAELNATPSQVPAGGITIIQRQFQPTLIAQGKILDPATGFSTTISFPDPALERSTALHASGVPIGTPTKDSPFARTGYFIPHVVVRNLTGAPQTATITVEFPKGSAWSSAEGPGGAAIPTVRAPIIQHAVTPVSSSAKTGNTTISAPYQNGGGDTAPTNPADLTGQITLAPVLVEPYGTLDYSLDAIIGQLALPVPYCSIRIQYSGASGSVRAQVSSVEMKTDMVIDSKVANEGNTWRGSGANPWHLDKETESTVFLTDESDKPVRIGFSVTAGGLHYYLTDLKLAAHETRAIDLRKLRDAQQPDFKGILIPASATDGSVTWNRLDNVPVSGRLVVMQRNKGIASNYDCEPCPCPNNFVSVSIDNGIEYLLPGGRCPYRATGTYTDCNAATLYFNDTLSSTWSSSNPSVASVDSSGLATAWAGGSTTISAFGSGLTYTWDHFFFSGCWTSQGPSNTDSRTCNVDSLVYTITSGRVPNDPNGVIAKTPFNLQIQAKSPSGVVPDTSFTTGGLTFTLVNMNTTLGESAPATVSFSSGTANASVTIVAASGTSSAPSSTRQAMVGAVANGTVFYPSVYWQATMDIERWKNCGFLQCPNLGSYVCQTAYMQPGFTQKTAFLAVTYSSTSLHGIPVLVINTANNFQLGVTIQDAGPTLNQQYWFTGSIPSLGGCISDALADALGVPYGCNPNTGQAVVLWKFN